MINKINTKLIKKKFLKAKPFNHVVIDSFWNKKNANEKFVKITNAYNKIYSEILEMKKT